MHEASQGFATVDPMGEFSYSMEEELLKEETAFGLPVGSNMDSDHVYFTLELLSADT